ncbi:MAG TPA: hypothetical protein VIX91_16780 [Candidatus Acidoferrum sp.]
MNREWSAVLQRVSISGAALLFALPLSAYDRALSPETVREAYFLGQQSNQAGKFLEPYTQHPPMPKTGSYISSISILTPYAQAVFRSWKGGMRYNAQQADEDYRRTSDAIEIIVTIDFTSTYSAIQQVKPDASHSGGDGFLLRPKDFWRDFSFKVYQQNAAAPHETVQGEPVYDASGFKGAVVKIEFASASLADKDTSIEVTSPDGQKICASFDLSKLR